MPLPKIIVILGPTASGKTDLGLALAKKFNGEIVSADSRQVYKKMDIGTAKPIGEWENKKVFVVEGIPHHLMDIVDPKKDFSLADYKAMATKSIKDILSRKKLPIVVGGTGLYIQALVENLDIPKVAPNKDLREEFEKKKLPELIVMLEKMDPETAEKIDLKNPRRVLRALEVVIQTGKSFSKQQTKSKPVYEVLQIGIDLPREELYKRINTRVDGQIAEGLIEETKKLAKKYKWTLPSMSGIGYKQIGFYLRGEMTQNEAIEILKRDTRRYAKRQMTWFKRDKSIIWIKNSDLALADKMIKEFLQKH
ncbi:MAG: tRNA dimethylallyltransferase [Parcubacteria group bacterium Gr01-1014_13]|nr:MAG: tRNA dimethylallyltransferase [Parcubacteria group bacterium Gr01-1014_13]